MRIYSASEAEMFISGAGGVFITDMPGDFSYILQPSLVINPPSAYYALKFSPSDAFVSADISFKLSGNIGVSFSEALSASSFTGPLYIPSPLSGEALVPSAASFQKALSVQSPITLKNNPAAPSEAEWPSYILNTAKTYVLTFTCTVQTFADVRILLKEVPDLPTIVYGFA